MRSADAFELAFNNGYRKGYEEALKDYGIKYWLGNPDGDIVCPTCGSLGPDNLPRSYLRHCSYCGQKLTFKE